MRRQGLVAKAGRKFKATTNPNSLASGISQLTGAGFHRSKINEKWAGDITYLRSDEDWRYLAIVPDLYPRRAIGWSMDETTLSFDNTEKQRVTVTNDWVVIIIEFEAIESK